MAEKPWRPGERTPGEPTAHNGYQKIVTAWKFGQKVIWESNDDTVPPIPILYKYEPR